MREEAEDFGQNLAEKYGSAIDYGFIDVDTEEMQKYPEAQAFLERIRLPFVWINGQPSFHGGFSLELMSKALDKLIH